MRTLLLMLTLAPNTALADDLTAFTDDLDEELDWDDDGTRPDSDASAPDADPTWDVDEDDIPLELDSDPEWDGGTQPESAGPTLDEDPEWDIDSPEDAGLGEEDPPANLKSTRPVRPTAVGRTPLADNYPLEVISSDMESVIIELPVLISQRRTELSGDFWLIGEIYLDGSKVGESRTLITPAGAAEDSPSFVWIKALAPIVESAGVVEVRLSRQEVGGASHALFIRTADYHL